MEIVSPGSRSGQCLSLDLLHESSSGDSKVRELGIGKQNEATPTTYPVQHPESHLPHSHRNTPMLARAILLAGLLAASAVAAEPTWPRWRGPNGDGQSPETDLPLKWNEKSIVWRTPLKGAGQSSPIVWGDRVFLTTAPDGGKSRVVLALDRKTGKILWEKEVWKGSPEKSHAQNGWATADVRDRRRARGRVLRQGRAALLRGGREAALVEEPRRVPRRVGHSRLHGDRRGPRDPELRRGRRGVAGGVRQDDRERGVADAADGAGARRVDDAGAGEGRRQAGTRAQRREGRDRLRSRSPARNCGTARASSGGASRP